MANEPFVIEYNVRMGDPESEVVFPRIVGDILPALYDSAMGNLKPNAIGSSPHCACTVMAVSGGYPEVYEKGLKIEGLDKKLINGFIFQAGTTFGQNGEVVTNGGRVISATGLGNSLNDAALNAYHNLSTISFKNMSATKGTLFTLPIVLLSLSKLNIAPLNTIIGIMPSRASASALSCFKVLRTP